MLLAIGCLGAWAGEVEGTASGFVELRNLWYLGVDGVPTIAVERFRPTFEADLSEHFHLETTLEVGLQEGRWLQDEFNQTLLESPLNEGTPDDPSTPEDEEVPSPLVFGGCSVVEDDAANQFFRIEGIDDYASIERLFADFYSKKADVRVGRQSVQWGNALLVHPADPFPEVLFFEPWKARSGVNAARLNLQLGEASALTMLGGMDDSLTQARAAGRLTVNVLETDIAAIGAYREESNSGIVGLDIKGTLELGFWVEGSYHLQPADDEDFVEVAAGLDYSFPVLDQFIFGAQYYFNGAGSAETDPTALVGRFGGAIVPPVCTETSGPLLGSTEGSDPFSPFFSGRDYGMMYTAVAVNDRWSGNAALVQNLDDGSGVAVPTVTWRPSGWSEVSLSGQIPYSLWGKGGELHPSNAALHPDIEVTEFTPAVEVDLDGLVAEGTLILWTRASF